MGSSKNFINFILISLFSLYKYVAAVDNVLPDEFHGPERDALLAIKEGFSNAFLDDNWTSIMCYLNNTPQWYGVKCLDGRVIELSLENLGLKGEIKVDAFFNLTRLSVLSFKNNLLTGNMMNFSHNLILTRLDLSSNKFYGPISTSLLNLNFLESLELQENNFNGSIPPFNQSTLRELNVSENNLSGTVPNTVTLQSLNSSAYSGNRDLCGPPSTTPCSVRHDGSDEPKSPQSSTGNSTESRFGTFLMVVNIVAFVVLILLFILYFKKSRKLKREMKKSSVVDESEEKNEKKVEVIMREKRVKKVEGIVREKGVVEGEENGKLTFMEDVASFELSDLLKASAEGLGKGNFGNCYKAVLDDGRAVAVKRLRDLKPLSRDEFARQLQVIADQKHPNLLPLLAFYYSKDERFLVHKFATNGNVYHRLHGGRGTRNRIPFKWSSRLSVAQGVARALEYLHINKKAQPLVPHGNLKSSNVLLDNNEMVLVTDYGFTSLISLPIVVQRMVAYKSPEYLSSKKISKKSDVWSYGCLLLELLTGRVSAHAASNGVDLGSWVHHAVREEWTAEIFDLEISVQRSAAHGMLRLLQLAVRCCDKSPDKRPDMSEVVREVENVKVIIDSEDDEFSDRSLTDDSMSATSSM
ncbi:hypothetical protein LguiA_008636 [Lonicera macranthoides]